MAQVMDAWTGMLTASTPAQLISQPDEHVVDRARRQRTARRGGEDGRVARAGDEPVAYMEVVGQGLHDAGVQGQTA